MGDGSEAPRGVERLQGLILHGLSEDGFDLTGVVGVLLLVLLRGRGLVLLMLGGLLRVLGFGVVPSLRGWAGWRCVAWRGESLLLLLRCCEFGCESHLKSIWSVRVDESRRWRTARLRNHSPN